MKKYSKCWVGRIITQDIIQELVISVLRKHQCRAQKYIFGSEIVIHLPASPSSEQSNVRKAKCKHIPSVSPHQSHSSVAAVQNK